MSVRTKLSVLIMSLTLGIISVNPCNAASATDSVKLYTPYTKISVPPGQSIDYTIDVINYSSVIRKEEISLSGIPRGWTYDLKSGGYNIGELGILPGERKSVSLRVDIPLNVNKGSYRFRVVAGRSDTLALVVTVSEHGSFKTEFTTNQPNMEGHATSNFTFNANLQNRTAEKQIYALMANAPGGWTVTFKSNYQQVTSVVAEANSTQTITIEIKPPDNVQAGKYKIPLNASTSATSANLELEVVITGTYSLSFTTQTGLLSTDIIAGGQKRLELIITNTGSAELKDINLSSSTPVRWEAAFDPKNIKSLEPGKSATVTAVIKADKKAIPGDYVTSFEARTPEKSATAAFRVSVETPLLWGWVGLLIIIISLGSVYYLFRKYGRR